ATSVVGSPIGTPMNVNVPPAVVVVCLTGSVIGTPPASVVARSCTTMVPLPPSTSPLTSTGTLPCVLSTLNPSAGERMTGAGPPGSGRTETVTDAEPVSPNESCAVTVSVCCVPAAAAPNVMFGLQPLAEGENVVPGSVDDQVKSWQSMGVG